MISCPQNLSIPQDQIFPKREFPGNLHYIKNGAKEMTKRYAASFIMYKTPEAISFVGNNVLSAVSSVGNFILGSENHNSSIITPISLDENLNHTTIDAQALPKAIFENAHTCAVYSALTFPVSQTVSYCARRSLGCRQDTPFRNGLAGLATFAATPTATAYLAKSIGYGVDPKAIFDSQVQGVLFLLKMGAIGMTYGLGMTAYEKCYESFLTKYEDIEDLDARDIAAKLSAAGTVGGIGSASAATLGYLFGYTTQDIGPLTYSLAKTVLPFIGITYLAKNIDSLVKEAIELIDETNEREVDVAKDNEVPKDLNQKAEAEIDFLNEIILKEMPDDNKS